MSFLKILSRRDTKGKPADPGKPDDPGVQRATRTTVVSFSATAPFELKVKVKRGKSIATLLEVEPGKERGEALRDELAVQSDKPSKGKP